MADEVKLSLPQRRPRKEGRSVALLILMALVLAVSISILLLIILGRSGSGGVSSELAPKELEDLAIQLEQQHLSSAAAGAWREYLGTASLSRKEQAAIWYRIGKAYEDGGSYEKALDAYYRSEATFADEEIAYDLGMRIQQSLERLGNFAALRQALSSRTSANGAGNKGAGSNDVIAEIGPTKITQSDLDGMIENLISDQLDTYRGVLSDDELQKQKEALFSRYATADQRSRMLSQYIAEELLYRKAREDKLSDDTDVRRRLIDSERSLLAGEELTRELADRIHITDSDLTNYYSAHKDEFVDSQTDPPRQKSFDEAKDEIYAKVYSEMASAAQSKLMDELRNQYDVVIHQSALQQASGGSTGATAAK